MKTEHVDPIVNAVVYEGHILYPYRPTALKNRRRFTFGRVYPRPYSEDQRGRERWTMTTECLVAAGDVPPELEVRVRFLHPMQRQVYRARGESRPTFRKVPNLVLNGEAYHSWQEVEEQTIDMPVVAVEDGTSIRREVRFEAAKQFEEIRRDDVLVGAVEVLREAIAVEVELAVRTVRAGLFSIAAHVRNVTELRGDMPGDEEALLLHVMASTHTVLQIQGGAFLSLTDPPKEYAGAVAACRNDGTWPVLVGRPGQQDTLLSSPIILYDYPKVAPESKGDLFDATEIDELLSLRIMTLTDKEKDEMRSVDEFARRILQRTEGMTADDLLDMHGTLRAWREAAEGSAPSTVEIDGRTARVGDRVRLRPQRRADAMDLSLAGRIGQIEAIEQNLEGELYLAIVLDDDPGKDLGMMRQPGHRFFYTPEEVELLETVS